MKHKRTPKKAPRKFAPSQWAALVLLLGLFSCAFFMLYASMRSIESDIEELEAELMPPPEAPFIPPGPDKIEVGSMLDKIWAGTVWIGRETQPGINMYVGTGWVVGNKEGKAYIATCAHVVIHRMDMKLNIGYLGKSGEWSMVPGQVVRRIDGRPSGDIALIMIDRELPALKFAVSQTTYSAKDEIYISGVQYIAPPAIITAGEIVWVDKQKHEFQIKGWGWFGFSGGPIILRKTGEVIGYVAWTSKGYTRSAMRSDCGDLTHLLKLLKACGLSEFIKE